MAYVDEVATASNNSNIIPPSYFGAVGYNSPNGAVTGDPYGTVANSQGNSISYSPAAGSVSLVRASTANRWWQMTRTDIVFNLNSYLLLGVTSAIVYLRVGFFPNNGPNIYGTTDQLALGFQRETVRPNNQLNIQNYYEVYYGGSATGVASNVYFDYHTLGPGQWLGFTLNAAGLAYLNSVPNKANFPGYALFGLDFRNHFLNQAATWQSPSIMTFDYCLLRLNYTEDTQPLRLNVGDDFKDCPGMQVNIGDEWKGVKNVYINIGDTWKTIV